MPKQIVHTFKDGTVLGVEEEKIFRGKPREIGFDELEVVKEISDDGKTVTRTFKYGDYIHAQSRLTEPEDLKTNPEAEFNWQSNLSDLKNEKVMRDIYVRQEDGTLVKEEIEDKITVYDWEAF